MEIKQYKTEGGALKKYNKELKFFNSVHPDKRKKWYMFKPRLSKDKWGFIYVEYWK